MKVHPIAALLPDMSEEEFSELVEDIRLNGQLVPIVKLGDEILDGRHRWRACEELGIAPHTTPYTGDTPAAYVCSLNLRRRNLNVAQRAQVAVEMLPHFEAEAKKRPGAGGSSGGGRSSSSTTGHSATRAAEEVGVSKDSVKAVKRIKKAADSGDKQAAKVYKDIKAGKIASPTQAERVAGTLPTRSSGTKTGSSNHSKNGPLAPAVHALDQLHLTDVLVTTREELLKIVGALPGMTLKPEVQEVVLTQVQELHNILDAIKELASGIDYEVEL